MRLDPSLTTNATALRCLNRVVPDHLRAGLTDLASYQTQGSPPKGELAIAQAGSALPVTTTRPAVSDDTFVGCSPLTLSPSQN